MPDPFLFLVREPAVLDDLQLSQEQRRAVSSVNEDSDPTLLAMRALPPQQQQESMGRMIADAKKRVAQILTNTQRQRLEQIRLRLRGMRSVRHDDGRLWRLIPPGDDRRGDGRCRPDR